MDPFNLLGGGSKTATPTRGAPVNRSNVQDPFGVLGRNANPNAGNDLVAAVHSAGYFNRPAPVAPQPSFMDRVGGFLGRVGNVEKGIYNSTAGPIVNAAKQNLPFFHPQGPGAADSWKSQQQAQMNIKRYSPQTQDLVNKSNLSPSYYSKLINIINDPKSLDHHVTDFIQQAKQKEDSNNKQMLGSALTAASLAAGGGEAKAALSGGANLVRSVVGNAVSGAVGNVGSTLTENPNASGRQLAVSGGQGAAFAGALGGAGGTLGLALEKLRANKLLSKPITTYSGGSTGFSTADKEFAKTFVDKPGAQLTKRTINPTEVLDTRIPAQRQALESVMGKDHVSQMIDRAGNGLPNHAAKGEQDALIQAADKLGYKHIALSETDKATKFSGRDIVSYASVDKAPVATLEASIGRAAPKYTQQVEQTLRNTMPAADTAVSRTKGTLGAIKNLFTPGGGEQGKVIANDLKATLGQNALAKNQEALAAASDVKAFGKMSSGDHLTFIQKIESGVKQATPELQAQADKVRVAQEADYKLAQSLKPNLTHVDNYFPRAGFWNNSPQEVDAFVKKFQSPSLGGKPTALQQRKFPTIYDGIKAGLVPKETNPALIALNSRTQLLRAKAAEDFIKQEVAKGAPEDLVKAYVDRAMGRGLQNSPKVGEIYRTAKDATYAINNLQLGFSGFHLTGTGLNAVVSKFSNGLQDLARGNIIKGVKDIASSPFAPADYIFKGGKIVKDFKAGNVTKDIVNIAEGGGRIGRQIDYRTTGLAKSLEQLKSGSLKEAGKGIAAAPFRAFSEAAKPVMEWWVPRIKAGATKDLIDRKLAELGPSASSNAIRAAKVDAVQAIDNRFGQLVQDNLMWDKTLKDFSGLAMRSPGWNIGTVREVGGGGTNLLKPSTYKGLAAGKGLPENTTYAMSLAATTALIGTAMSYMFTGKPPQDAIDYFYPKTGKTDKNGNDERVALPTYAKDVFAFSHNPGQTIANKSSPLVSAALQLKSNKDYFGNQIRNTNDSLVTQAKQVGGYVGKTALPFSLTNSSKRVDQGVSPKIQNFFGLTTAPGYITQSPFQQKLAQAVTHAMGTKSLTPEEVQAIADKAKAAGPKKGTLLERQLNLLIKADRPAAAQIINQATPKDLAKITDPQTMLKNLAYTSESKSKSTKQETKDASNKLLDFLNKSGQSTQDLSNQKKSDIKAKQKAARRTR